MSLICLSNVLFPLSPAPSSNIFEVRLSSFLARFSSSSICLFTNCCCRVSASMDCEQPMSSLDDEGGRESVGERCVLEVRELNVVELRRELKCGRRGRADWYDWAIRQSQYELGRESEQKKRKERRTKSFGPNAGTKGDRKVQSSYPGNFLPFREDPPLFFLGGVAVRGPWVFCHRPVRSELQKVRSNHSISSQSSPASRNSSNILSSMVSWVESDSWTGFVRACEGASRSPDSWMSDRSTKDTTFNRDVSKSSSSCCLRGLREAQRGAGECSQRIVHSMTRNLKIAHNSCRVEEGVDEEESEPVSDLGVFSGDEVDCCRIEAAIPTFWRFRTEWATKSKLTCARKLKLGVTWAYPWAPCVAAYSAKWSLTCPWIDWEERKKENLFRRRVVGRR